MKSRKEVAPATMKDVAQKAQVSTATVSRALMNPDKVSQATRNRVEQAALEVGYFPQAMGRNVKRNESRTILVIVPDICDPFFSEIIRGIEVTAAEQGYLVLIGDCAHQNQQEKTFIDLIITKQIDGMLLLGSRLPFDASIEEQRNLPPMVMANEFAPELELPTVHIDNLTAAFNAVNYLQELGHKRIGCIAGPEEMPLCHYRLQGYVQALRRTGVTVDPHYIARGDFTFAAGGQALEKLLDLPEPPTANRRILSQRRDGAGRIIVRQTPRPADTERFIDHRIRQYFAFRILRSAALNGRSAALPNRPRSDASSAGSASRSNS